MLVEKTPITSWSHLYELLGQFDFSTRELLQCITELKNTELIGARPPSLLIVSKRDPEVITVDVEWHNPAGAVDSIAHYSFPKRK